MLGGWLRPQGPRGQARTPKKGVSTKSISSRGFGVRGSCHTFSELGQQGKQNFGSRILIFGPQAGKTGPEGGAGGGSEQNFWILTSS